MSRNRTVGERLGRGERIEDIVASMSMVAEGVKTAGTAVELGERYGVELPICREIHRVIAGQATAFDAYRGLLRALPGHESEPG
jgi:glycerol-3-phosphate dehydrogenase (NAD(P)+)